MMHYWKISRSNLFSEIAWAWKFGFHGKFRFNDEVIRLKRDTESLTIYVVS